MLILPTFCFHSVYTAVHGWRVLLKEVLWVRVCLLLAVDSIIPHESKFSFPQIIRCKKCKSPVLSYSMVTHNIFDIVINSPAVLFTTTFIPLWTIFHQHVLHMIQYCIKGENDVL